MFTVYMLEGKNQEVVGTFDTATEAHIAMLRCELVVRIFHLAVVDSRGRVLTLIRGKGLRRQSSE